MTAVGRPRVAPVFHGLADFLSLQRLRVRTRADRIVERHQRRMAEWRQAKELESQDTVETRGLPQAHHRDYAPYGVGE